MHFLPANNWGLDDLIIFLVFSLYKARSYRIKINCNLMARKISIDEYHDLFLKNVIAKRDLYYAFNEIRIFLPNLAINKIRPEDNLSYLLSMSPGKFFNPYYHDQNNLKIIFEYALKEGLHSNPQTFQDLIEIILKYRSQLELSHNA